MKNLQIASVFSKLPALALFCYVGTNIPSPLTQDSKVIYPKWAERWQCPANQPALPTLWYLGLIQKDQNTEFSWAFEVLLLKLAIPLPMSFSVNKGWESDKHCTVSWTSPVRTGINIYWAWRKHIWWWVHLTLVETSRGWSMFLCSIRRLHKSIRRKEETVCPTGFAGGLLLSGHGSF